jgi:hypothetical protein
MTMKKWTLISVLCLNCHLANADPIWHCSRIGSGLEQVVTSQTQDNQFSIASFGASADTIGVSIGDLIDIYSGVAVSIGGLPLSACFISGNEEITTVALTSLGLKPAVIQALARKSSIVQSNLHAVATKRQMLNCIEQHFPAVGYLEEVSTTDKVNPCF